MTIIQPTGFPSSSHSKIGQQEPRGKDVIKKKNINSSQKLFTIQKRPAPESTLGRRWRKTDIEPKVDESGEGCGCRGLMMSWSATAKPRAFRGGKALPATIKYVRELYDHTCLPYGRKIETHGGNTNHNGTRKITDNYEDLNNLR